MLISQSVTFYLPEQKLDTLENLSTTMAGYKKVAELIKLVTYCNSMNAYYNNLTLDTDTYKCTTVTEQNKEPSDILPIGYLGRKLKTNCKIGHNESDDHIEE